MRLCFPVERYNGLDSNVYGHFGSAPSFAIVDTESNEVNEVINLDSVHAHGKCSPLKALDGQSVDCVIVGGIGAGALGKLIDLGIQVYRADSGTVGKNISLFSENRLSRFNPSLVCGGHARGGSCSHS